jgi:integrating conjugative element protein (TIGR03749 family)
MMQIFIRGLLLVLCLVGYTQAVEIQTWERIPLALPLIVGAERIVFVDQNVRVGLPKSLSGKLRVQSTGGAIYLMASEPIPPTRVQLQNIASGEIMLVDIAAKVGEPDQPPLEAVKIVARTPSHNRYGGTDAGKKAEAKPTETALSTELQKRETPLPVVLTRYVAQMLYAPLRTVEPIAGISQVRLDPRLDLTTLIPTLPIKASALGAWRLEGYWVTAVKLQNTSTQRLTLDPRELMGDFVAATFQHPNLTTAGEASDTTTLYLVTRGHGLAQSLLPSNIARIDPKGGKHEK